MKSSDAAAAPAVEKTTRKQGRGKKSTCTEARTSAQELASAKPLGRGKKFSARSPVLSVVVKASIGAAIGKPKHALNLFGSNPSASDDESAYPESSEVPLGFF
jgi:hypothetical protein